MNEKKPLKKRIVTRVTHEELERYTFAYQSEEKKERCKLHANQFLAKLLTKAGY